MVTVAAKNPSKQTQRTPKEFVLFRLSLGSVCWILMPEGAGAMEVVAWLGSGSSNLEVWRRRRRRATIAAGVQFRVSLIVVRRRQTANVRDRCLLSESRMKVNRPRGKHQKGSGCRFNKKDGSKQLEMFGRTIKTLFSLRTNAASVLWCFKIS